MVGLSREDWNHQGNAASAGYTAEDAEEATFPSFIQFSSRAYHWLNLNQKLADKGYWQELDPWYMAEQGEGKEWIWGLRDPGLSLSTDFYYSASILIILLIFNN